LQLFGLPFNLIGPNVFSSPGNKSEVFGLILPILRMDFCAIQNILTRNVLKTGISIIWI
jgi:hypothetical protein